MYTEYTGVSCDCIGLTINFGVTHDTFFSFSAKHLQIIQLASLLIHSTEDAAILRTAIKLINLALPVISHYYKLKSHTDETTQKQNVLVIVTH
jgi:hypothetical protein